MSTRVGATDRYTFAGRALASLSIPARRTRGNISGPQTMVACFDPRLGSRSLGIESIDVEIAFEVPSTKYGRTTRNY